MRRRAGTLLFEHFDLGAALRQPAVDRNRRAVRRLAGVVHRAAHGHRQRNVILHLLQTPMVLFEEVVDRLHLLFRTAGEVGDEERNEVLLLAALSAELLEDLHEAVELLDVAVVLQAEVGLRTRGLDHVVAFVLLERLPALSRSGAACGHYITDDQDRLAAHKLLLFPFSIAPDPAQVRALEKLKNSNRILVFFNGADSFPHRPGAPKGKNGDFTGIRIAKSKHSIPGDFTFSDVPGFTDGLAGKQFGSAKKRIDPAFLPDAPSMVVLARDSQNNPVVAMKKYPGWTAVYCTQNALPARFRDHLAAAAGVHRYIDTPDVVWANRSQVAVCVDQPGKRTIRLPEPRRVREMFSGQTVSNSPVSSFDWEFSRGETALFELMQ